MPHASHRFALYVGTVQEWGTVLNITSDGRATGIVCETGRFGLQPRTLMQRLFLWWLKLQRCVPSAAEPCKEARRAVPVCLN
jgi:hypothetical protein